MRYFILAALGFAAFLAPTFVYAQETDATGYWLTQNKRSVIHTYECQQGLCGDIYWIIEGGMTVDEKNPDPAKRTQALCGMKLLWGFKKDGKDWEDGKIYKADDGDTYSATVSLQDDGSLYVRGYVSIPLFGKSQTWTRVSADDYAQCKAPE